ncbi:glycosyltransferase [Muricauda sp. TY007]|uniref:glycosyltransferase family 4 protein n=1 Tax=Allomuricauda sp. TY007 TaxID=2683200 RepID=UPI0013C225B9|nr:MULTISPECIES: glycosyltransferase family 4 protein [unclassified Allomuricauda]MBA4744724.1 glycosyltransferase family 4 protein [Allomuricauda sp.]NDV17309.1 glycosyltransferase [Muricauda sp. TY007]
MKIDFVIDSLDGGGAERVMATLANGFAKTNNVTLITFNEGEIFFIDSLVKREKLYHGKFKNHTLRSLLNLFQYYKGRDSRPDVVISFMPMNAFVAVPIAKLFGFKIIVSEHTNHLANLTSKKKYIRKFIYPLASAVTVLTHYDFDFFRKLNPRVVIMPNPIILPTYITLLHKRKKNILAAGALNRYEDKGFDSLLKIAAPLLHKHKEWTLTIAGNGDEGMYALTNLSKELNIENQVILPGFCEDIQDLMQGSQIFILPSKFEGLPMVLMEALSNGMACVAYDCISGPRELIEHKINGLLVENQNTKSMQQNLRLLLEDEGLRLQLAKNAPKSMRKFELSEIINKWNGLFKELTAK